MKIIPQKEHIDEGMMKNALIGTTMAASALVAHKYLNHPLPTKIDARQEVTGQITDRQQAEKDLYVSKVLSQFKISPDKASTIVDSVMKHSNNTFPKPHHLLGLIGKESSFNEHAVSKLAHDPAIGLTQIRPKIWGLGKSELSTIDGQIKHSAHILKSYYEKTGTKEGALHAYNLGITSYNRGKLNPDYVNKINKLSNDFKIKDHELDGLTNVSTKVSKSSS